MKIAIIGAGNIGSLLGALLANTSQDVTLVELRKDIVGAVQAGGVESTCQTAEPFRPR